MNCLKNQGERYGTAESWSLPPHVAYRPMRVSRSVAQTNLHPLANSRYTNECRSLHAAGGFFPLDDDDHDYLLEDSHAQTDSTVPCLCTCGHKQLDVSYHRRPRSFLGYLPDVEEEISMPFPGDLHGSRTAPMDENFCYSYTRPESNLEFIYSNPSSLGLETSGGVSYFSTNTGGDFHSPRQEEEILVNSSFPRCTPGHTRPHDQRRMLLATTEKFRCTNQESSDIYNGGISFDSMNAFRNMRYEGIQSPGFGVHFRNRQGALVPNIVRHKKAMSNYSTPEGPSSSSASVSSDETEHPQLKVGLYKTELCRSWEETGFCRYGAKCQLTGIPEYLHMNVLHVHSEVKQHSFHVHSEFAHGNDDLRPVPRHPKYKTELCRSFTETGLCSYGKRCRFVHSSNTPMQPDMEKTISRRLSIFQQLCGTGEKPTRQT